jgi:hypothetical protein
MNVTFVRLSRGVPLIVTIAPPGSELMVSLHGWGSIWGVRTGEHTRARLRRIVSL